VQAPAHGVLFGAWVKPDTLSQSDRVAAVDGFEAQLGRSLDIVNTYRRFTEPFYTSSDLQFMSARSTLMLSWAGGDSRAVASGQDDALLRDRADRVAADGRPVLMRYRWEMDRPNLRYSTRSGPDFIAAWKHVRDIFAQEHATNVSWVWCPTSDGFAGGYAADFYPGDDQVDWICVDVYAGTSYEPLSLLLSPFLSWAANHPKPLLVGEFGVARAYPSALRAAWLNGAAALFKDNPQIKGVCYFESNPDANATNQQFRVGDDPPALAALRQLATDPYFNSRSA
jgi:hypothetical protein